MHRTRQLLQSLPSGGGLGERKKKFILPNDTFFDRIASTLQGLYAHVTDQSARDKYEQLVADKVIQDTVLAQARSGNAMTMALFWNLQNPLFAKYQFDAKQFVSAVGPALENFQDTLGQLVLELNRSGAEEKETKTEESSSDSAPPLPFSMWGIPMGGGNEWSQRAKEDPDSLEARLQRMVSDAAFDDHYYGAKLFQALTSGRGGGAGGGGRLEYVPGSGVVQSVALLNARVMEIPPEDDKIDTEHPEFEATEGKRTDPPVAARMDVLYEISQDYRQSEVLASVDPLSASAQYKAIKNDDDGVDSAADVKKDVSDTSEVKKERPAFALADEEKKKAEAAKEKNADDEMTASCESSSAEPLVAAKDAKTVDTENKKDDTMKDKTRTETTLAVAILEGWLHGGPENTLKWRVSLIRDAYEFS